MGNFIDVDPRKLKPSQDFLKLGTVAHIRRCISDNDESKLPPPPVVRFIKTVGVECIVAIDGHNLIAVRFYLKEKIRVWVADNCYDHLPMSYSDTGIVAARVDELLEGFDDVESKWRITRKRGIKTFKDLVTKYQQEIEGIFTHAQ